MRSQIHVYVKGEVIGVGFRAWVVIQANMSHLSGWVRNAFDKPEIFGRHGGVEGVFQGTRHNLQSFIDTLHEGPSVSRVDDVEVYWQEPKEIFTEVEIRK